MHINQHWLNQARHIHSPNFDDRPDPDDISLLVIHCISLPPGEFGNSYIEALFCNRLKPDVHPYFKEIYELRVSSHLVINRMGDIVQFVPFDKRAWHAGQSSFEGRNRCNDFSIGIELEGTEIIPYTETQYQQLAKVVKTLLKTYTGLSSENIAGHSDIAPGRKTDPGDSFDWDKFYCLIQK
jgi:N-acetyl-anhydromuramoyl-L-alanine amidase